MDFHLLVHNATSAVSAVIAFAAAIFVFLNAPKKRVNILASLLFFSVAVFIGGHAAGVSVADPLLSRSLLMLNLSVFFIASFNLHAVLALIKKEREHRALIFVIHASALLFVGVFIAFPGLFLLPSEPKMYFPNYYEPGLFNWTRMAFLYALVLPLALYYLIRAYAESASSIEKNQYKFFALTMAFGYVVSFFPNFLVYDLPIDPMWGTLFAVFFIIPFVYGAVQYGLFNIEVIAKQAFWYGGTVALVGGFITFINFLDQWVRSVYPPLPFWILPLVSAAIAVGIGVFVWEKLRVADLLKYEFVNVVTHKFRTPLTYIGWAIDQLEAEKGEGERRRLVAAIRNASERLIGLTHILVSTVKADKREYAYDLEKVVLSDFLRPIIAECREKSDEKNIRFQTETSPDTAMVKIDARRMQFVFQNIIENAILYTSAGGEIDIRVEEDEKYVTVSVRDSGIGISESDLPLIFNDFFRSASATTRYTEGMGVGLYISKNIVLSHDGKIWAESEGEGKGATFFVRLPKAG